MIIYTWVKIGDGGKMSRVDIIKHAKDVAQKNAQYTCHQRGEL
jgi:hypothetical protein